MLARYLRQPACVTNLALHEPGRCSSSCGNGTSPGHVNDGDLRQYAPHVWQACDGDPKPWWSVRLPQPISRPFVRVLIGDSDANSFRKTVDVHIGADSGLVGGEGKCASLLVDEGSAVGAFCEGEGEWVTISAQGAFSLAEIQICDAIFNPLLRQPLTSAVDMSSGLLELDAAGTSAQQLLPTLSRA